MYRKTALILIILLMMVGMNTVSGGNEVEQEYLDEDFSYSDIPAPEGLEVWKGDDDVILDWDMVEGVDHYKVYYSRDIYARFPFEWSFALTEEDNWTHEGALLNEESYYYVVRGVQDGIEGRISKTGFCEVIQLPYDHNSRLHYISMPVGFNNHDSFTASDIVMHVEGGTGEEDNEYIDQVVKWDYTERSYTEAYSHAGFGWGGDDFIVEPEAAVGLRLTNNLTWHVNGVELDISMNFEYSPDESSLHYISVPYTMMDISRDGELRASDIVLDIEGDLGSSKYIDMVVKWDYTVRGYTEVLTYSAMAESWGGDDFLVEPKATVGLRLIDELNWTPTITDLEPPIVESVELDDDITLQFSKNMNLTSFEGAVSLDGEQPEMYWENNSTLRVELNSNLSGDHVLTIEASVTDTFGNTLDGNGDGVSLGAGFDDFVYEFSISEDEDEPECSKPEIGAVDAPEELVLGEPGHISVNVTGAENVFLNYSFLEHEHNVSMDGNGIFNYSFPSYWDPGFIEYHIAAVNKNGTWNRTGEYVIELIDPGISSSIVHNQEINSTIKTENITVSVTNDYPIAPDDVQIYYVSTDDTPHNTAMVKDHQRWTYSIPPQNRSGTLVYWFSFQYMDGPEITSQNYTVTIDNPLEVNFHEINGEADNPLNFEISLSSPVGILEATLHYEVNGSPETSSLMLQEGDPGEGIWVTTIDVEEGEIDYHVSIVDMDGEMELVSSSEPIYIEASSSELPLPTLYLLPLIIIVVIVIAFILSKKKTEADTPITPEAKPEETAPTEPQQVNISGCTICFGELHGTEAWDCPGCGNSYHADCLHELGECPVCGRNPHT